MNTRALQRRLCSLCMRIAPADMREWAVAMVREIDEIEDAPAALEWAAQCLASCAVERFRAILRLAAVAARLALGGYCLVGGALTAIQIAGLVAEGRTAPWKIGSWLLIALLVAVTGPLLALRRPAAAWTLCAATAVMAGALLVGVGDAPPDAAAQERLAGAVMVGAMLLMTGAAFRLTRRPDVAPVV
jgi:hypothetical protein